MILTEPSLWLPPASTVRRRTFTILAQMQQVEQSGAGVGEGTGVDGRQGRWGQGGVGVPAAAYACFSGLFLRLKAGKEVGEGTGVDGLPRVAENRGGGGGGGLSP